MVAAPHRDPDHLLHFRASITTTATAPATALKPVPVKPTPHCAPANTSTAPPACQYSTICTKLVFAIWALLLVYSGQEVASKRRSSIGSQWAYRIFAGEVHIAYLQLECAVCAQLDLHFVTRPKVDAVRDELDTRLAEWGGDNDACACGGDGYQRFVDDTENLWLE